MSQSEKICNMFKSKDGKELLGSLRRLVPKPYEKSKSTHYKSRYVHTTFILNFMFERALYCIRKNKGDVKLAKKIVENLKRVVLSPFKGTITLTFGEVAESHVGMQKIGKEADEGFSLKDLEKTKKKFHKRGYKTLLVHLNDFLPKEEWPGISEMEKQQLRKAKEDESSGAYVLVIRNGLKALTGDDGSDILTEMLLYKWDTMLYNERRNIVQNKNARYNVNFDKEKQVEDFSNGKGTTISWSEVPILTKIKKKLDLAFGEKAQELKCEGNLYYETSKETGIGYHGDTERKKVIGVRLGKQMNIHWMWYFDNLPRGTNFSTILNPGDIYCMSEKTVGTDWRKAPKKKYALRHAAGAPKYTTKTPTMHIRDIKEEEEGVKRGEIYFRPKKSGKNPHPKWKKWNEYN
jgi:hypothetical protein